MRVIKVCVLAAVALLLVAAAAPASAVSPVAARLQKGARSSMLHDLLSAGIATDEVQLLDYVEEEGFDPETFAPEGEMEEHEHEEMEEEMEVGMLGASVCAQQGGTCKDVSGGCSGGSFSTGLCPGAANIKCCKASSSACSNQGGSCRDVSVGCAGGSFSTGLCPGDANIKCCKASASACSNQGGTCKATSSGCSGSFSQGLCPGAANIQCCKQASSACSQRGGTCKATSEGCSGSFTAGLCPGAANIQCCTAGGGGSCGVYTGAAVQSIVGNGNQAIGVVRIVQNHLTNPAIYGRSPYDEDNTMKQSTACAFDRMATAARNAGVRLTINSAFRTYNRQVYFWNCYQTKKCNNGNVAAYPGTSNHGVGLALDINTGGGAYAWLARNAHGHGFVRTVPSETWHWEHRPGSPPAPYT